MIKSTFQIKASGPYKFQKLQHLRQQNDAKNEQRKLMLAEVSQISFRRKNENELGYCKIMLCNVCIIDYATLK